MGRISIGGVLGLVAVLAFGLAALILGTEFWVGVAILLAIGSLLAGVLGVILRGWRGGGWLGFLVFGWGYFLLITIPPLGFHDDLAQAVGVTAGWITSGSNPRPPQPASFAGTNLAGQTYDEAMSFYNDAMYRHGRRYLTSSSIAYWLSIPLFAGVGAILGVFLAKARRASGASPPIAIRVPDMPPTATPHLT